MFWQWMACDERVLLYVEGRLVYDGGVWTYRVALLGFYAPV